MLASWSLCWQYEHLSHTVRKVEYTLVKLLWWRTVIEINQLTLAAAAAEQNRLLGIKALIRILGYA